MSAFLRKYGTGTGADIYVPVIKRASVDFAVSGDWSPAAGDVKISKDGGAAANIGTLPTAVTMGNTAMWKFIFADAELQAKYIVVTVSDSATKAVEDQMIVVETYGNASAMYQADLSAANLPANVVQFGGSNATTSGGRPEVNTTHWAGTAVGSANVRANIIQCNGNSVAAGAIPNAAAGANGGLPTVNASNYIAGLQGTINTLDALDTAQDTQHSATQTILGVAGAGLTAIPWNASWDAEVQSEVDDALIAKGLDHLVFTSVSGTDIADDSIIAKLVSKSATADWDSYTSTTDSLEALRDRGDAAWTTATGFSTHSAADVWAVGTRTLTAATNITSTGGTITVSSGAVTVGTINDGAIGSDVVTDIFGTHTIAEAYATDGSAGTPAQLMYLCLAALTEFAISGTTITVKKLDGSTTAATYTLDSSTTPTSRTRAS